jgi:hypothetical protein
MWVYKKKKKRKKKSKRGYVLQNWRMHEEEGRATGVSKNKGWVISFLSSFFFFSSLSRPIVASAILCRIWGFHAIFLIGVLSEPLQLSQRTDSLTSGNLGQYIATIRRSEFYANLRLLQNWTWLNLIESNLSKYKLKTNYLFPFAFDSMSFIQVSEVLIL